MMSFTRRKYKLVSCNSCWIMELSITFMEHIKTIQPKNLHTFRWKKERRRTFKNDQNNFCSSLFFEWKSSFEKWFAMFVGTSVMNSLRGYIVVMMMTVLTASARKVWKFQIKKVFKIKKSLLASSEWNVRIICWMQSVRMAQWQCGVVPAVAGCRPLEAKCTNRMCNCWRSTSNLYYPWRFFWERRKRERPYSLHKNPMVPTRGRKEKDFQGFWSISLWFMRNTCATIAVESGFMRVASWIADSE